MNHYVSLSRGENWNALLADPFRQFDFSAVWLFLAKNIFGVAKSTSISVRFCTLSDFRAINKSSINCTICGISPCNGYCSSSRPGTSHICVYVPKLAVLDRHDPVAAPCMLCFAMSQFWSLTALRYILAFRFRSSNSSDDKSAPW